MQEKLAFFLCAWFNIANRSYMLYGREFEFILTLYREEVIMVTRTILPRSDLSSFFAGVSIEVLHTPMKELSSRQFSAALRGRNVGLRDADTILETDALDKDDDLRFNGHDLAVAGEDGQLHVFSLCGDGIMMQ